MINARGLVVLAIVCAAWIGAAAAQHRHPAKDAAIHERFYSTWMMPDAPHVSCCNLEDCAPALKAQQDPMGVWHAQRESDGQWFAIPQAKVEINHDSPDGRSHLCMRGDTVLCFIAGSGI